MIPLAPLENIPPYHVSKWLKLPLLLSIEEIEDLFSLLPDRLILLGGVISPAHAVFSKSHFFLHYQNYLQGIVEGNKRPFADPCLTCALTNDLNDLRGVQVANGLLVRIFRPVIQIQPYTLCYSKTAEEFRELTHSLDSFYWGLVFSIPQLFDNPLTQEIEKVTEQQFPNMRFFKEMQRWSRIHTTPTPFQMEEKIIRYPARIGKQLLRGAPCIPLPQK